MTKEQKVDMLTAWMAEVVAEKAEAHDGSCSFPLMKYKWRKRRTEVCPRIKYIRETR